MSPGVILEKNIWWGGKAMVWGRAIAPLPSHRNVEPHLNKPDLKMGVLVIFLYAHHSPVIMQLIKVSVGNAWDRVMYILKQFINAVEASY